MIVRKALLRRAARGFASDKAGGGGVQAVFDRSVKVQQRDNSARLQSAAALSSDPSERVSYSYFREEIATRLIDRLEDVKERDFELGLDLGSGSGYILDAINREESLSGNGGGMGGVKKLVQVRLPRFLPSFAPSVVRALRLLLTTRAPSVRLPAPASNHPDENASQVEASEHMKNLNHLVDVDNNNSSASSPPFCSTFKVKGLDETTLPLPFPDDSFDVVISSLSLHWCSDLQGTLCEVNRILRPDGALFLAITGGDSLPELRCSLLMGEQVRIIFLMVMCGTPDHHRSFSQ